MPAPNQHSLSPALDCHTVNLSCANHLSKPVKVVFVSDTHEKHHAFAPDLPSGDILIHCGDFWTWEKEEDFDEHIKDMKTFFEQVKFQHKVFVCGNHEIAFSKQEADYVRTLLAPEVIYLQDTSVELCGLTIHGTPWNHCPTRMGFAVPSEELAQKFGSIPTNTDILVTHLPPLGVLDRYLHLPEERMTPVMEDAPCSVCARRHGPCQHRGSEALFHQVVDRVKPLIHAFGHVHHSNGVEQRGSTLFVNAAMDLHPKPVVVTIRPACATSDG